MSRRVHDGRWLDAAGLVGLVVLIGAYVVAGQARVAEVAAGRESARRLVASDSEHYLEIARAFAGGDFSFSHVTPTGGPDQAHRQPLYAALLAPVLASRGRDLAALAMVNVVLVAAAMALAYFAGRRVLGSRLAGLAGAAAIHRVPFLWANATERLLTEPAYVVLGIAMAIAFFRYLQQERPRWLFALAAGGALAYLDRVNGLFLALAALAAAAACDAASSRLAGDPHRRRRLVVRHAAAAALFVVVTMPSWLPRLVHAGNPLYHGYLANFLWVDSYEEGHLPGPPRYVWRDYVRGHGAADVAGRVRYGLHRVFYSAPREKYGDLVAGAMLAGLVVVALARRRPALVWTGVGVLQMLPLAWTALANPARRLPATAFLAFGVIVLMAGVAELASRIGRARRDIAGEAVYARARGTRA